MDETLCQQVKHLYEIEGLSMRQITKRLGIGKKRVSRIIKKGMLVKKASDTIMKPYERLIWEWYKEYPSFKATQVYKRLKSLEFSGSYTTIANYTQRYRKKRIEVYHELIFLPGEESQIDWMTLTGLPFGVVYGFVFILCYSRYLYTRFYHRQSLEFFLDGHIEAYKEIGGIAQRNRYDNLKSVVISRIPEVKFNAQFLDFARHYGFSIYPCNPYRANEKGRVERVIRDIRDFLKVETFKSIDDLNKKTNLWRIERNKRIHRSTGKAPVEALKEERLKTLPAIHYKPYRVIITGVISKTGFIEFETNRYSVPYQYVENTCEILAYPQHIEILVRGSRIAVHQRSFERGIKIENPSHREKLLNITPNFKNMRIYQLIQGMDLGLNHFLKKAEEEGDNPVEIAYEIFKLLKKVSRGMLLSAIRQANDTGAYKLKAVYSLLKLPESKEENPVYPQDVKLLKMDYERRELKEYDELI